MFFSCGLNNESNPAEKVEIRLSVVKIVPHSLDDYRDITQSIYNVGIYSVLIPAVCPAIWNQTNHYREIKTIITH